MRFGTRSLLITMGIVAVSGVLDRSSLAQSAPDSLWHGFVSPPASAKPRVWWHWMNGNITKEGIKLDLEWMHRVGLGGYQSFDAAFETPQVVMNRLAYMTPDWRDTFRYATVLGDQLGLEEAIASSPGWSESGGPWVAASQGMKKYVWSATLVEGGKHFVGKLAHPPSNTGAFQDLPINDPGGRTLDSRSLPEYYADSVVVAYRRPAGDIALESMHPKMTASGGAPDFTLLASGNLNNTTQLPVPKAPGQSAWIRYEFREPETLRAVTIATHDASASLMAEAGMGNPAIAVETSDDGAAYQVVARLSPPRDTWETSAPEHTIAFEAVTAKYFRIVFEHTSPAQLPDWQVGVDPAALGITIPTAPANYAIAELILHGGARVNRWEDKAAFVAASDLASLATPPIGVDQAVRRSDVVELTSKMQSDGTLDWIAPPGDWVVLRFGYSLLGITNHPATEEATGLEVDKFDRAYVKQYLETYLGGYEKTVGPDLMGENGIRFVVNDSWEAGSQNWTDNMVAQFKRRRGYDPVPWMPVLTGIIVDSSEASDRFLWDFRKTIADLVAEEHYGQLEETLHEHHMGHYGESHEIGRQFVADGMEVKKYNEVPMSAMWAQGSGVSHPQYGFNADDRESASVAHIYGQNLAAAESMTAVAAPWAWSPATLKPTVDQEFLNGINRIVIHESAHQPLIGKPPGLTLGPYGQWFNRNETWAEQAAPWVTYLARSSFMLQQGRFVADIVYFYGEDSNLTAIFAHSAPNVPAGYGFDYINADALIHELSVTNGRVVTRSGMSYRVLGLDPYSRHMSLPVLRALHALVENGAVVAGPKPTDDASLADDAAEFQKLNDELFGDGTGTHNWGKGTVYAGQHLGAVLRTLKVPADFDYTKPESDTSIFFVHRKLAYGDLYFVDNRSDRNESVDASFRVTGKAPELWRAETGRREPTSFKISDGRTTVPLKLEPWGTVFVVFRTPTTTRSRTLPVKTETTLASVDGEWRISFQPGRGAPSSIMVHRLESWSWSADAGVKYFSGIGTYIKSINASADWFKKGAKLWLDLGVVKNLAEVTVNGKSLGVIWQAPFRVDVTTALKPGSNELSIKVINAWVNRLIGDQQPGVTTPITFADVKPYNPDSPLLVSGLLGPVHIVREGTE
jgi:hypothetical protein